MATVQARIPDDDKEVVERILDSMGLDVSTAIRAYFAQIRLTGSIPFPLKSGLTVNGFTPEFEQEVLNAAAETKDSKTFDCAEDLIADLNEEDRKSK